MKQAKFWHAILNYDDYTAEQLEELNQSRFGMISNRFVELQFDADGILQFCISANGEEGGKEIFAEWSVTFEEKFGDTPQKYGDDFKQQADSETFSVIGDQTLV